MSPRKRTKDKDLPSRVYRIVKNKRIYYFYVDINNKWHSLGKDYIKAMAKWAILTDHSNIKLNTMDQIFDRYLLEVAPYKAKKTYLDNIKQMKNIKQFFGQMLLQDVEPIDIYSYLDKRGKESIRGANLEKGLLSHCFTKAIEWGAIKDNPCSHVKRLPQKKRTKYVTDEDFYTVMQSAPLLIQLAMELAYLTGLRKGDILTLKHTDITIDGLYKLINKTQKTTGREQLFEWEEELTSCINKIKNMPRRIKGMYIFCTRNGKPYTTSGFDSIWQRVIKKAFDDGAIAERFRFHDIRRKTAKDAEAKGGIEYARRLLGHETQSMTANYIGGENRVKSLK